jgi:glycosyltransferase involved in cell wall biosynthesis
MQQERGMRLALGKGTFSATARPSLREGTPDFDLSKSKDKNVTFAFPGDLATPTGGYIYDAKIIPGLREAGVNITILSLGDGFPYPTQETRDKATQLLADAALNSTFIVDGLALGILPEAAKIIAENGRLIALVHHPLALETGVSEHDAARFKASETLALSFAQHVIVTSPTTAKILADDYGVAQNRLHIALPGVEQARVEPATFSQGSNNSTIQLLSVAAISQRKGFDVLVAALSTLKALDWHLKIAGDLTRSPDVSAKLLQQVEDTGLNDRITFLGAVSPSHITSLYTQADIFVLASRYEGYGMAYAEALAQGLPIIGTTGGAIPDVVPQDAGILVPPDDARSLANALSLLIQNKITRASFAAGAQKAAANLPRWSDAVNIFKQIIGDVRPFA